MPLLLLLLPTIGCRSGADQDPGLLRLRFGHGQWTNKARHRGNSVSEVAGPSTRTVATRTHNNAVSRLRRYSHTRAPRTTPSYVFDPCAVPRVLLWFPVLPRPSRCCGTPCTVCSLHGHGPHTVHVIYGRRRQRVRQRLPGVAARRHLAFRVCVHVFLALQPTTGAQARM